MKRPTHDKTANIPPAMNGVGQAADAMRAPANVVISTLSNGMVGFGLLISVVDLLAYDAAHHQRIFGGGGRIFRHAGVNIAGPRNSIVREFLDTGVGEWLWMVDADMTFPPDAIERLLAYADPVRAPIVGGLCFGATDGQLWPTMYDLVSDEHGVGFVRWTNIPDNAMVQVTATGGAALLMHRDALAKIGVAYPGPFPWFQETSMGDEPLGEDLTFCLRAGACGIPIYVHTGVQLGHVKSTLLNYDRYAAQFAARTSQEQP